MIDASMAVAGPWPHADIIALAILIPFAGRLSCTAPGDLFAHAKRGGVCIYTGWHDDLALYLEELDTLLTAIDGEATERAHSIHLGDARSFAFPVGHFSAMLTSPPYPNHRDFASMFGPENALLRRLSGRVVPMDWAESRNIIGSNFVAGQPTGPPNSPTAKSTRAFFDSLGSLKRTKGAVYDDDVYYVPYFSRYFSDLERAYSNVVTALAATCEAYIVVVNNTHRGLIVPVAECVMDIWRRLGFQVNIETAEEAFHIGSKNPRARGVRSKHIEYVIRVARHQ
jgi:hypothetical protein